jgi:hypothetical protein
MASPFLNPCIESIVAASTGVNNISNFVDEPVVTPRRYRVFTLREFILKMYDMSYLKSGTILDVAGGKGDLSWLFTNADGLESVVVDPRITDHKKLTGTCEWLEGHPVEKLTWSDPSSKQFQPLTLLRIQQPFLPAKHIRMFMDQECVDMLPPSSIGHTFKDVDVSTTVVNTPCVEWDDFFRRATVRAEEVEGTLAHHQPKKKRPRLETSAETSKDIDNDKDSHIEGNGATIDNNEAVDGRITCSKEALRVFHSAKLLVGFHPDEATEAIIDMAVQNRIPFVIVPCCVFPKLFSHRRLNGKSVSTYMDFVRYLKTKHPAIREASLPFHAKSGTGDAGARSTVLFTIPGDYELVCSEIKGAD